MKKPVSFKTKESDLIEWIKDKDFSYYIKNLIRKDMEENKKVNQNQFNKKRNSNFSL